jgi:hypothetical protein
LESGVAVLIQVKCMAHVINLIGNEVLNPFSKIFDLETDILDFMESDFELNRYLSN